MSRLARCQYHTDFSHLIFEVVFQKKHGARRFFSLMYESSSTVDVNTLAKYSSRNAECRLTNNKYIYI